jgi:DNA-binding beta-propeller fold protein YncE
MMTRIKGRLISLGGGCLVLVMMAGCATAPQAAKKYTFFPPSPDEPKIQFLTAFSSDADLGRTRSFSDYITGQEPAGSLVKPYGLALHSGRIFVCDTVQNLVEVFDLSRRRASYFSPPGEGHLRLPINITIDTDGTRYVADTGRRQVVVYSSDGSFASAIGKKDEMKPSDVAVSMDRLYIADMQNHCVQVYSKADQKLLFSIPRNSDTSEGALYSPANLALDQQNGRLLVSDVGSFSVKVFDLDGKYLRTIGRQGLGPGMFSRPKGIAVDRQGLTYVVDAATQAVQIFDAEGRVLLDFGRPGTSTYGQLTLPASVKVDYDHVRYFEHYLSPGYQCEYLILVVSQFGGDKVSVYGFLKKK